MNDRFLRACRHEPVDATPVWFMRQAGRSFKAYRALRERYGILELAKTPELCAEVTLMPVRDLGVDAAVMFADIMLPLEPMGIEEPVTVSVGVAVATEEETDMRAIIERADRALYSAKRAGRDRIEVA